eukprot:TRINITY_DN1309_c2_g1_i1.p1 TRINITY_DN1309_c2_g1~~TRINITY_DN1309_c2_g1_i1.p1  ORF type:complete len:434 (+),score=246.55 TRINITY_DN1309_c2_g1_i1:158-1459(+)
MGKKAFIDPKKASTYALVHKSVEDPTYEDESTARTLAHVEKNVRKRANGGQRDILKEEMQYSYDMQNPDDTVEAGLFDDQVEADFDQDFIQQMMDAPEEEEEEEELDEYPKHEATGDLDAEFAALMKNEYKNRDMEIEENDPRTDGLMPVDAYVPALKEFVDGRRRGQFLEENRHEENFVNRLEPTGEEVFHQQHGGQFYTAITSKKDIDIVEDYHEGMDEARSLALKRLEAEEQALLEKIEKGEVDVEAEEGGEPQYEYVTVKRELKDDRFDCQTVLTTMSTLENHPGIIGAEKGRIRIDKRTGKLVRENKLTSKNLGKLGTETALEQLAKRDEPADVGSEEAGADGNSAADDEGDRESVGETLVTVIDTTVKRCKDETAEEKRQRKEAVKETKRMARLQKKELKTAYKAETLRQRHVNPVAKQAQAELSLR